MPQFFISRVIGSGRTIFIAPGNVVDDTFRSHALTIPGWQRVHTLGMLGDRFGPFKGWVICEIWADDYTPFNSDNNLINIADRLDLDTVPPGGKRNQINNFLGNLGATTRAQAGDSCRVIINSLLAELGSLERV